MGPAERLDAFHALFEARSSLHALLCTCSKEESVRDMADNGGGDDVLRARAPGAGAANEPSAEVRLRYGLRRRGAQQGRVLLPMHEVAHLSVLGSIAAHCLLTGPRQAAC